MEMHGGVGNTIGMEGEDPSAVIPNIDGTSFHGLNSQKIPQTKLICSMFILRYNAHS